MSRRSGESWGISASMRQAIDHLGKSKNKEWKEILTVARKAAMTWAPVLITGESGTIKEVLASFIHAKSKRAGGPFVTINCGAIPENLLESKLFGYMKGAHSEAKADYSGLLAKGNDGTIFLDEIGEMPQRLQVKLLRFLQDKVVRPLGSSGRTPVVKLQGFLLM